MLFKLHVCLQQILVKSMLAKTIFNCYMRWQPRLLQPLLLQSLFLTTMRSTNNSFISFEFLFTEVCIADGVACLSNPLFHVGCALSLSAPFHNDNECGIGNRVRFAAAD
mmetsp:Transcript_59195/g.117299  ORF Transcript_59195/g.117299 Transcript_59195/m.117299 type:complete len:109 (+) Transcript_59195:150-476(+)